MAPAASGFAEHAHTERSDGDSHWWAGVLGCLRGCLGGPLVAGARREKPSRSIDGSTSACQASSSAARSRGLMTGEPTRQERPVPPGNNSGEPFAPKAASTWRGSLIARWVKWWRDALVSHRRVGLPDISQPPQCTRSRTPSGADGSERRINLLNPREEDRRVVRGERHAGERSPRHVEGDADLVGLACQHRHADNQVVA
jgi:hypothetical protein